MADERLKFTITAIDRTAAAFRAVKNRISSVTKAAAVGVGAVAGVGLAMGAVIKKTANFADEIAKTADKVGVSTSALQELRISTDLAGISQQQLDTALGAMSKRIGELRAGTGALNTFLNKTDKAFADQLKSTTSNEQAFRLLIGRIEGMTNAQDRAALSAAAFSRSAGIALSKLSLAELDEGIARARELGLIIDEELLRNAEKIKDDFELAAQVIKVTFMKEVLKALQDVDLTHLAKQISNIAGSFIRASKGALEFFNIIEKPPLEKIEELTDKLLDAEIRLENIKRMKNMPPRFAENQEKLIQDIQNQIENLQKLVKVKKEVEKPIELPPLPPVEQIGYHPGMEPKLPAYDFSDIETSLKQAETPLQNFVNNSSNLFNNLQEIGVSSMHGIENALMDIIDGTTSAKDAFKSLAKSVIDDILRMTIRMQITIPIARALNSALGGAFGGTSFAGTFGPDELSQFAHGGVTSPQRPYIVGEKGPELFMPGVTGRVVPNHSMGGQGSSVIVNQTLNIETGVSQTVRAEIAQLMPQIADNTKAAVLDARRRGGSFANGFA